MKPCDICNQYLRVNCSCLSVKNPWVQPLQTYQAKSNMKSSPEVSKPSIKKAVVAVAVLTYIAVYCFYSIRYLRFVDEQTYAFILPLFFSIIAVIVFLCLRALVSAKWLPVVCCGVLALIVGWYWNTPFNYRECAVAGMKDARTPFAAEQIRQICEGKFKR